MINTIKKVKEFYGGYGVETTSHGLYIGLVRNGGFKVDALVSLEYGDGYKDEFNKRQIELADIIAKALSDHSRKLKNVS